MNMFKLANGMGPPGCQELDSCFDYYRAYKQLGTQPCVTNIFIAFTYNSHLYTNQSGTIW